MSTSEWRLDRHIPVALILAIMVQTGAAVWWASKIDHRVETNSAELVARRAAIDSIPAIQAEIRAIQQQLMRIETKLDGIPLNRN